MGEHDAAEDLPTFASGQLSDAVERLGLATRVLGGWRYVSRTRSATMLGPACTVRQVTRRVPVTEDDRNLTRQREVAEKLAQPGDVVVVAADSRTDVATWGENLTLAATARGVAGLVVDGCIRDSEAIRNIGLPVLCRGYAPTGSRTALETTGVNVPVDVGGVTIQPGDIIFGDADGMVVISASDWPIVKKEALSIKMSELDRSAAWRLSLNIPTA